MSVRNTFIDVGAIGAIQGEADWTETVVATDCVFAGWFTRAWAINTFVVIFTLLASIVGNKACVAANFFAADFLLYFALRGAAVFAEFLLDSVENATALTCGQLDVLVLSRGSKLLVNFSSLKTQFKIKLKELSIERYYLIIFKIRSVQGSCIWKTRYIYLAPSIIFLAPGQIE